MQVFKKEVFNQIALFCIIAFPTIVLFREPAEIYLGYAFMVFLLPFYFLKYNLSKTFKFIALVMLSTGIFYVYVGENTIGQFSKIFLGVFFSYTFFYFFMEDNNKDVTKLFKWYLKFAYWIALIAIIQVVSYNIGFRLGYDYSWILNKWGFFEAGPINLKANSIVGEPTHLGNVLSSAVFVAINNLFSKEKFGLTKFQGWVIIIANLISFSGAAYGGFFIALILVIINYRLSRVAIVGIPILIIVFQIVLANVKDVEDRFTSTQRIFTTGEFKLGRDNGSAIILYDNYLVSYKNLFDNPLFGTGLGSHPYAFNQYSKAQFIKTYGFANNYQDASSMLFRTMSELGIFGMIIIFIALFKYYKIRDPENNQDISWIISNALLVMILLNLARQGHYFLNGFPFFVWLYIFNKENQQKNLYKDAILSSEQHKSPNSQKELTAVA